ncbi:hypothetical protein COBT_003939, partial [Conglomerata obtusa]
MILAILNRYSKSFEKLQLNFFFVKLNEERLYYEDIGFGHIMQNLSLFFNNMKSNYDIDKVNQCINFKFKALNMAEINNLFKSDLNMSYDLLVIENCFLTEKDIFFAYNVISKIHKISPFSPLELKMIFALNCKHPDHKISNFKLIDTNKLEFTFAKRQIIDGTYAEIAMQNNFCQVSKSQKECNIGRLYRYDKLNKKLYHVNDIHCGNS